MKLSYHTILKYENLSKEILKLYVFVCVCVCVCVCFGDVNMFNFYFFINFINLSFLTTTLKKKIPRTATKDEDVWI